MNTEKIVLVCICFFFVCIPMFSMGLCILLSSPCIFRIDKRKNCCTMGRKALWQNQYKMKSLCKLSEVKEAIRKGNGYCRSVKLFLRLKSGKDIVIFKGLTRYGRITDSSVFDNYAKKINLFLNSKNEKFEVQHQSFDDSSYGVICILISCFGIFCILKEIGLL